MIYYVYILKVLIILNIIMLVIQQT